MRPDIIYDAKVTIFPNSTCHFVTNINPSAHFLITIKSFYDNLRISQGVNIAKRINIFIKSSFMKQIFVFILTAAMTLGMSARQPELRDNPRLVSHASGANLKLKKVVPSGLDQRLRASESTGANTVEGVYTIHIEDVYFDDSKGDITEECTVTLDDNIVTLDCIYFTRPVKGEWDASNSTITFNPEYLGQVTTNAGVRYMAFLPITYVASSQTLDYTPYSVTYNNGTILFPELHGFGWILYTDAEYTQQVGVAELFNISSMEQKDPDEDPNQGWTGIGEATLYDPWLLPGLSMQEEADKGYGVEMQRNDENPNLYRLVDPYKGKSPAAQLNSYTGNGYITFDITDPEHVLFTASGAGFANQGMGIRQFYCMDQLSAVAGAFQMNPGVVIAVIGDELCYSRYEDGVLSLGSMESEDVETGELFTMYAACFGIQGDPYGGYGWTDDNDALVSMNGRIVFPGYSGISGIRDEVAPVEYYDLTGNRIDRPRAGQIVIMRQGSNASKIVYQDIIN